jgi:hypothetical protein
MALGKVARLDGRQPEMATTLATKTLFSGFSHLTPRRTRRTPPDVKLMRSRVMTGIERMPPPNGVVPLYLKATPHRHLGHPWGAFDSCDSTRSYLHKGIGSAPHSFDPLAILVSPAAQCRPPRLRCRPRRAAPKPKASPSCNSPSSCRASATTWICCSSSRLRRHDRGSSNGPRVETNVRDGDFQL